MKILTKAIKEKLIANHKEQDGTKEFKAVLKLQRCDKIISLYDILKLHNNDLSMFATSVLHPCDIV